MANLNQRITILTDENKRLTLVTVSLQEQLHNAYIILISYIMTKKIIAIIEKLYFMLNK